MARPKRTVAVPREERWGKKAKPWADSSKSASNEEDGPSREASEHRGHQQTRLGDELTNQEQFGEEALSAGTGVPPSPEEEEEDDDDIVVLKSKVGKAICLSSDSEFAKAGSAQGLDDGQVESSATPCRGINVTGGKKRYDSAAPARSFDCTACGGEMFSASEIHEHPKLLGVGICSDCYDFLFSSPFTKDIRDNGEEQCRWCGQGGRIVMCDECDKGFCEDCIVRNYGRKNLAQILDNNNWSCFCCNPELLSVHVDELKEFRKSVPSETNFAVRREGAASLAGKPITRDASDMNMGTKETIAELLTLKKEERRKQNKGTRPNSRNGSRVKSRTQKARASRKRAGTFDNREHAKILLPTEVKRQEGMEKQAPSARTWIRPHQWIEKRQEAAERRKHTKEAEAQRLKNDVTNVPNGGSQHHNSNKQAKSDHLPHVHCDEGEEVELRTHRREIAPETAKAQVKVVDLSDEEVGNESKVKKADPKSAFDRTPRNNLFAKFTEESS